MDRIPVAVFASDPLSRAGVAAQLRSRPELTLTESDSPGSARVGVVVADGVDEYALRTLRVLQPLGCRTVLVTPELDDTGLAAAVEAGVAGFVRRAEATGDRLAQAISAAARGEGTVPPDLLGRLLEQVGRLQRQVLHPRGLVLNGLSGREIEILKLVADGLDTGEIARTLSYSERTIKNVLHDVTSRLQLRNRSHAVAYALRQGLI